MRVSGALSGRKKNCLVTVISNQFVFGAIAMLTTFRATNPWFDGDIIVLHNRENSPLSEDSRALIEQHVSGIIFREVDNEKFAGVFKFAEEVVKTPKRLRAAFYILEAFMMQEYERVVALDSDMIILGSLRDLFEMDVEFGVVRAVDHVEQLPLPYFNTGTMVLGKGCLSNALFDQFVAALDGVQVNRSHGKADQAVLNIFFRNRDKFYFDTRYNYSKRFVSTEIRDVEAHLRDRDVRVFHYVGEKPWNIKIKKSERDYRWMEDIWLRAFLRHANKKAVFRFVRSMAQQEKSVRTALIDRYAASRDSRRLEKELEAAWMDAVFAATGG